MIVAAVFLWITATTALQGLHSTVASVRDSASPALLDGIEAKAALSDADRAAWLSFLSGEDQFTGPGQQYQNDITTASRDLESLAALEPSGSAGGEQLQTISGQLVNYQALVENADAAYRTDIALGTASDHDLGYADLTYASNSLRDPQGGLLADISQLITARRQALDQQLASPWTDPALFLALATIGLLGLWSIIASQRFLTRRFRRRISPPLLLAAALVCGLLAWMAFVTMPADAAFATARDTALPKLTKIWRAETNAVDTEAAALLKNHARSASGAAPAGLSVTTTQRASNVLDADLASAEDTGGLPAGIPALAALIAGLAYLGIKPRLDEYRE